MKAGEVYTDRINRRLRCIKVGERPDEAVMRIEASGWIMLCHGLRRREDGRIEYDFSTGGHFEEGAQ